ncbi:MAG: ASKHA domain-containing protein [Candidatus Bipolaricaulota bacterium]
MTNGGRKVGLWLLPEGRKAYVEPGITFLAALTNAGVYVPSECGGLGRCGKCKIRFPEGPPEPSSADRKLLTSAELADGWRLSCAHTVAEESAVVVPQAAERTQDKVQARLEVAQSLFPAARRCEVSLAPPAAELSLIVRLEEAVGSRLKVPSWLFSLLSRFDEQRDSLTVTTVGREVMAFESGDATGGPYGLALDVGTTTVAAYLLDLESGHQLAARAAENRQGAFGADVVSRISYTQQEGAAGISRLQDAIQRTVNLLVDKLTGQAGVTPESIVQAVVVGNPTMLHLLVGADPQALGRAPFEPVWRRWLTLSAAELGLSLNRAAHVELVPLVSGYVGADVVAGLLACGIHESTEPVVYLDLGTNGEILLAVDGRMVACSAAAGPAFEAVGISCGMSALEGAVSRVEIDGEVRCRTINSAAPKGLCGTGLTDAVAELLRAGIVDAQGRMRVPDGALADRVEGEGNQRKFMLARGERPVYVSQADIRKLQLAKAALRSGVDILLQHIGLSPEEVKRVYLAGAFGAQMRTESLIGIGLLPGAFRERVQQTGNAAGVGAKAVLADRRMARQARRTARQIEYLELAAVKEFGQSYVRQMWFHE